MKKMVHSIPDVENEVSKSSKEMKIPSMYDNVDWGKKKKLVNRKVSSFATDTGTVYGSKAILTKESFAEFLISESDSDKISELPQQLIGEIKKNIRTGAKDLAQDWANALELTNKAYMVANVSLPSPQQKMAWKQYEAMIKFSVGQLADTRGMDGKWRSSSALVREAAGDIGKRRYFVEIPGERAVEVEGEDLDDIVERITNKIRNSKHVKGTKVRVEEKTKTHAVLVVMVDGVKKERIIVKQV